jgi:hypothetical protein
MRRRLLLSVLVLTVGCGGAGNPSGAPSDTGIRGQVIAAPTCPVETGDPECEPRPVEAHVYFESQDGPTRDSVRSGSDGTFAIDLPPGEYEVYAEAIEPGERLTPKPMRVRVTEGTTTQVQVVLDTGIRSPS